MNERAKTALQWIVALGIIAFLFRSVAWDEVVAAARGADLTMLIAVSFAACFVWFLLDSSAIAYLITRFQEPLPRRDARSMRALSYIIALVNWNLGNGAIIVHLRHSRDMPMKQSLATFLFYTWIDAFVLTSLTILGIVVTGKTEIIAVAAVAGAILAGLLVMMTILRTDQPQWAWLQGLRTGVLANAMRRATLTDFGVVGGVRVLYFSIFVVYFLVGMRAFGAELPVMYLVATVPIILVMSVLPVTPAGLGTQQAAMLYCFRPYASDAAILAFGLLIPVTFTIARLPLALYYLSDLKDLRRSLQEEEEESEAAQTMP